VLPVPLVPLVLLVLLVPLVPLVPLLLVPSPAQCSPATPVQRNSRHSITKFGSTFGHSTQSVDRALNHRRG